MSAVPAYFRELGTHYQPELQGRDALEAAFKRVASHEEQLAARLLGFLNSKANVRIIGEKEADQNKRVPTISFVVEGRHSEEFPLACDPFQIGIRFGDFYAKKLIPSLGLEKQGGVVRVSLVHYNTLAEVDRLIEILDKTI